MNHKIKTVLVPRPKVPGEKLAQHLKAAGFESLCQPIMTYQSNVNEAEIRQHLIDHQPNVLVFVSIAAV